MYPKKVLRYFKNPVGAGEIKNPDAVGRIKSPVCGDNMRLYLKVKNNKIIDVKWQTFGCAAAISSSTALVKLVRGKTIKHAKTITMKNIIKELGFLPKEKLHCAAMVAESLRRAIKDYEGK